MKALYIASTGMAAQERNVEVISNNIANMRTTGYKRARAEFQDLLYQSYRQAGSATSEAGTLAPVAIEVGSGVKTAATPRISGVSMRPGARALTLIPDGPSSPARCLVGPVRPALVAG